MSIFLCKVIGFVRHRVATLAQTSSVYYSLRLFSVRSSSDKEESFVVSYLINSLGFSPKTALSTSKHVDFKTAERPDKVIELFKSYGFTHTQISNLVRISPLTLVCDVEKTILPKLEFLISKSISVPELAKGLSLYPSVLRRSLANQIVPAYEFFSNILKSDKILATVVQRYPNILIYNVEKQLSPNICTLRQHGVADSRIAALICSWPFILAMSPVRLQRLVEEVVEMGFDPSKHEFCQAVYAMDLKIGKPKWDSKVAVYKKWGWSDEEVLKAFRKSPRCMIISAEKITALMDFFIAKMGLRPCDVADGPMLWTYSLEKRIIPRVSFYQVLLSRGLVEKEANLSTLVMIPEKKFLEKFVTPLAEEAPELLKLYKEKLALSSRPESGKV